MKRQPQNAKLSNDRRGVVTVEAAIIMPVLIFITIGSIDVGQFINISQIVSTASREGARVACRDETETVEEAEEAIRNSFYEAFPHLEPETVADAVQIEIVLAGGGAVPLNNLAALPSGQELWVSVSVDFSVFRWIQGPNYFDEEFRSTSTVCRRE